MSSPKADQSVLGQPKMAWESGIFSCTDDTASCCDGWCCCPCQIGHQHAALSGTYDICSMSCVLCTCIASTLCLECCCILHIRRQVIHRFNIEENCCTSCLCATCCPLCSLCQTHRELRMNGTPVGGICSSCISSNYTINIRALEKNKFGSKSSQNKEGGQLSLLDRLQKRRSGNRTPRATL